MAVVRWDPWGELAAIQRDVAELLNRAFPTAGTGIATSRIPPIDAYRTDDGLVVRVELPGIAPADVEVEVQDGQLTITGERHADEKVADDRWLRRERSYGRVERSFTLPEGTDPDSITATFEHGVLELRIPHPPERQARRIPITATGAEPIDVSTS